MSPQIALALCLVFILALVVADSRRRGRISFGLWIPLCWILILGSRPASAWFGVGTEFTSTDEYLEGSPFDRLVFLLLIVAGIFVLARRGANWPEIIARNGWLFLYFSFLGLSVVWSDYSFTAFKRWFKDVGNIVMALVILSEANPTEAVRAVLARCAYILVPLSVILIKYYPGMSRYYDQWVGTAFYCGAATDKNLLGMALFVCGISLCWMFSNLRGAKGTLRNKAEAVTYAALLAMTVWLFSKADSSTALASTVFGAGIILALRLPWVRRRVGSLEIYMVAAVLILGVMNATMNLTELVVGSLGRDLTFTGRTEIWRRVMEQKSNPLIGTGFYSFWLSIRAEKLGEYHYSINEAHNGYLETYLNTGLIGLGLLVVLLVSALRKIKRQVIAGEPFGALRLAFLISTMIYNMTESAFNRLNLLWVVLLLVMIEFPRPKPAPARSQPEGYVEALRPITFGAGPA